MANVKPLINASGEIVAIQSGDTLDPVSMPAFTGDATSTAGTSSLTIAAGAVTLAKMANVATGTLFYRKTASTGVPEVQTLATLKTDLGLTGTNSGDQTITLTGHVTGSGTGSFTTTIANGVITNAMQTNMAANTLSGNNTGSLAAPADLTVAQVKTLLAYTKGDIALGNVENTALSTWAGSTNLNTFAAASVTLANMANVATGTVFYRKTAATGAPEVQTLATLKIDLGLTGTNSGDQTITLTSDVTGSGTGSFAATIANNVVTFAKMQTVATNTLVGRSTAGTGNIETINIGSGLALSSGTLTASASGTPGFILQALGVY